jgi:hypothetical protein
MSLESETDNYITICSDIFIIQLVYNALSTDEVTYL